MPFEPDSEQIPGFAFLELCPRIDRDQARYGRVFTRCLDLTMPIPDRRWFDTGDKPPP